MQTVESQTAILKSIPLFSQTPEVVLVALAAAFDRVEAKSNERIITKGENGTCMYLLAEGQVKVHDEQFKIAELTAGALFGEFSLLDSEPRSASVTTQTTAILFRLEQDEFYAIMEQHPQVLRAMIRQLLSRMRTQNHTIVEGLRLREAELTHKVEERTRELKLQNEKLALANEEITMKKAELENAYEEMSAIVENLNEAYLEIETSHKMLQEKNRSLEDALQTISSQQQQLVQSEKMATLGEIMPIIAHEINTPLKTINLSAENLTQNLPFTLKKLPELFALCSQTTKNKFWALVDETLSQAAEGGMSAQQERASKRKLEERLADELSDRIEEPEDYAFRLVKAGFTKPTDELLDLLRITETSPDEMLDMLCHTLVYTRHFYNIRSSSAQAQEIITALNRYVSQSMAEDIPVVFDLESDLKMVLKLYEYYLRQGIELTVDLKPTPKIMAYEAEITQIWKNILMFCVHRMNEKGKLKVELLPEDNFIVARFADNGPELNEAARLSLFNGLLNQLPENEQSVYMGMAIAVQVIKKHQGSIEIESGDWGVCFSVSLPLLQNVV